MSGLARENDKEKEGGRTDGTLLLTRGERSPSPDASSDELLGLLQHGRRVPLGRRREPGLGLLASCGGGDVQVNVLGGRIVLENEAKRPRAGQRP